MPAFLLVLFFFLHLILRVFQMRNTPFQHQTIFASVLYKYLNVVIGNTGLPLPHLTLQIQDLRPSQLVANSSHERSQKLLVRT